MMTWYDDAVRTIIDLPDDQLEALADLCRREGVSRAEAIRQAIAHYMQSRRTADGGPAFGLWRTRPIDGLAYERRLRDEWERGSRVPAGRSGRRR